MAKRTVEILVKGGKQRSWDWEVGYGTPPPEYLENRVFTYETEASNIKEILKTIPESICHDRG
jgi:hypothetical protein